MSRVIVIGGGAIGLSLARHLAGEGQEVLLLERNSLTSGTSWHAAGIVGPLRATPNMTRLAMRALTLFPELEAETGLSTGYRRTGGFWLARRPERLDELYRIAAVGREAGLSPVVGPAALAAEALPGLNLSDHAGCMAVPEDGNVNPVDLCMAYARSARARGAEIREGATVARILARAQAVRGVELADGTVLEADRVALCAGAWSRPLAAGAGLALPLQAVEHMYVVTRPLPGLPDPVPVLRDMDTGIYIKGDAGKLVIGGFEPEAKCWDAFGPEGDRPFLELPEDWDQFSPFMEAALDLLPGLAEVGIQHFMNGPESFTFDTRPLLGEAPGCDGLFVAAGMNSVGIMSSAGIGEALGQWMLDGHPPMDMWEVDIARADPASASEAHMRARMAEAVSDLMAMHWPYKQPRAGRGLRKSVLHEHWAAQGAVFGMTGGWERGLWYARDAAERDLPHAVGDQPWWPLAAREAAEMATGTALLDLSPFTKIEIGGPGARRFMEGLVTASLEVPPGRVVYTPVLNDRGGIEAEVTVTPMEGGRFLLVSGAATRWRDLALLRRRAAGDDVRISDRTGDHAVIGVMGAGARALLAGLSESDWAAFPFGTARAVRLAGAELRATRLSFVGEPGWELMVPVAAAGAVFDALIGAGARPMGHYALDGCRLEKGFRHWGHDIGPGITPLEAGLGFAVDWSKDFTGKPALERQRAAGIARRLCLLAVEGGPLLLHDEPVREAGRRVGWTTSGARGPRTGLDLAFALIDVAPGETLAATCARDVTVEVAGRLCPARVLARPPFDPAGERMRA